MTSVRKHQNWSYCAPSGLLSAALAAATAFLPLFASRAAAQEEAPTYSVLYTFSGGADGASPLSDLIRDRAGNLYGTTYFGGDTGSSCLPYGTFGCGVVFKLDPAGTETVLHTFSDGGTGRPHRQV